MTSNVPVINYVHLLEYDRTFVTQLTGVDLFSVFSSELWRLLLEKRRFRDSTPASSDETSRSLSTENL
jgi:hypothetical protein